MKITLTRTLPVETRHGLRKGRTFEVLGAQYGENRGSNGYWVRGDAGENVLVKFDECIEERGGSHE